MLDDSAWGADRFFESCYAYRNQYDLPIGFRANASLLEYDPNPEANPFDNLNTLFGWRPALKHRCLPCWKWTAWIMGEQMP